MGETSVRRKIIGVIPARFGSTRFQGKPLKKILDKPLLQWVIEGAKQSKKISDLIVATDDQRIFDLSLQCGAKAKMTDSDLPSGSDRVWAAVADQDCDYVLNIQGDEPLINGAVLDTLADAVVGCEMATLARPVKNSKELESPQTAKIVVNSKDEALYFSRFPIPYSRNKAKDAPTACLKHIGLYGYSREFLKRFCEQKPTELELAEGLEQLRALHMGAKIKIVRTEYDSWGVDTPEDVVIIEQLIQSKRSPT